MSGERRWVIGAHRQYDIRRALEAAGGGIHRCQWRRAGGQAAGLLAE